jgi:threonine aldolase
VSVCFSKGLGAPVGSALAGPSALIARARRHRKLFGGGMRQSGVIAAGALYALEHHVERLADDHANAQRLAAAIRRVPALDLRPPQVDTNIVVFRLDPRLGTAQALSARLRERGVLVNAFGPQLLRAVTHLDVDAPRIERAAAILAETVQDLAPLAAQAKAAAAYG